MTTDIERQETEQELLQIGSDLPPAALADTETEPTGGVLLGIRSRMGFELETFTMRLLALIGFSVIVAVLIGLTLFIGFDDRSERLFLLSFGHLIVAPLLFYAAIRFGFVLTLVFVLAVVQAVADAIELVIRIFTLATVLDLLLLGVNLLLLVLSILYAAAAWRTRAIVRHQNERARAALLEYDTREVTLRVTMARERLRQQESNAIRVVAVCGLIGILFAIGLGAIFLSFDRTGVLLLLFSIGHVAVALYALVAGVRGSWFTAILVLAGGALLALDLFQLIVRIGAQQPSAGMFSLTLAAILNLTFLLINITLLLIDVVYIITAAGYLYVDSTEPEASVVLVQSTARATTTMQSEKLSAMLIHPDVRRRKK